MAPYIPFPGVARAECRFTWAGQEVENVFHFNYDRLGFLAGAQAFAQRTIDTWWAGLRPALANNITFREVYVTDLATQDGPVYLETVPPPTTGVVNTPSVPNNVAYCVTLRTPKRGRAFRGRSYVAGLAQGFVINSTIDNTALGFIAGAYSDWLVALQSEDLELVVASRQLNGAPRAVGVGTPVFATDATDTTVDSQRRRLPGRGR